MHQVPQGEPSVIESDEDYSPLRNKRKESTAPDVGPFMKKYKVRIISELANTWRISI